VAEGGSTMHGWAPGPFEIDLHLTNRCNLRCAHCGYDSGVLAMPEHDSRRLLDALDGLWSAGAAALHMVGGEPFLCRDLIASLLNWAASRHVETQILTNAWQVTPEDIERTFDLGLGRLLVSIDGDVEAHDRFRKMRGSAAACLSLVEFCTKMGYPMRVNTVASRHTGGTVPALIRRLRGSAVAQIAVYSLVPKGRGHRIHEQAMTLAEWRAYVDELDAFLRDEQITSPRVEVQDIYRTRAQVLRDGPPANCFDRRKTCVIMSDGEVYPCFMLTQTRWSLGNVYTEAPDAVWCDDARWTRFAAMATRRRCAGTAHELTCCRGGCPAYSNLLGRWTDCDLRCEIESTQLVPACYRGRRSLGPRSGTAGEDGGATALASETARPTAARQRHGTGSPGASESG
jgi:radical SAM protein with 4Fe4S-binding SPASM domain